MIGIVLEQFRKIQNSSRTLEHIFTGAVSRVEDLMKLIIFILSPI